MPPVFFGEDLFMLIPALLSGIPSLLFSVACYVLTALAMFTIARRRCLRNPWLAWVPVVNCWLLGSLSDQYQYVVKGRDRSKRKVLLFLSILMTVFTVTIAILAGVSAFSFFFTSGGGRMMRTVSGPVLAILGMALPLVCVWVAYTVIRFLALFDVYRSLDPSNAVLFLVLSIFFGVLEPFFLFFNRNKDAGMPPRKQPVPEPEPVQQEWTEEPETDF